MNEMPVHFSRMAAAARDYVVDARSDALDSTHTLKVLGSSSSQMTRDFAPMCDGDDNLLGDNPKQSSKYKRIIYTAKIIAALKSLIFAWDLHSANQYSARNDLTKTVSNIRFFTDAVCKDSDINSSQVPLGIDTPLFYYAASVSIHDSALRDFALVVRHFNKKQLRKLKSCMEFADKTDIFPLLGNTAKPAKRKYKALKVKAKEDPFHQLVDAFIAKRIIEENALLMSKMRRTRKR